MQNHPIKWINYLFFNINGPTVFSQKSGKTIRKFFKCNNCQNEIYPEFWFHHCEKCNHVFCKRCMNPEHLEHNPFELTKDKIDINYQILCKNNHAYEFMNVNPYPKKMNKIICDSCS